MIASPNGAVGEPPTGGERGYGGRQRLGPSPQQPPIGCPGAHLGDRPHSVHHGAAMALATTQVQIGHDLRTMEPGFLMGDDPDVHEDLIKDSEDTTTAIMDIASAQDVVNRVFK